MAKTYIRDILLSVGLCGLSPDSPSDYCSWVHQTQLVLISYLLRAPIKSTEQSQQPNTFIIEMFSFGLLTLWLVFSRARYNTRCGLVGRKRPPAPSESLCRLYVYAGVGTCWNMSELGTPFPILVIG